jgi:hypothetical protein
MTRAAKGARSWRESRDNGEHGPGPEIPRGAPKGERPHRWGRKCLTQIACRACPICAERRACPKRACQSVKSIANRARPWCAMNARRPLRLCDRERRLRAGYKHAHARCVRVSGAPCGCHASIRAPSALHPLLIGVGIRQNPGARARRGNERRWLGVAEKTGNHGAGHADRDSGGGAGTAGLPWDGVARLPGAITRACGRTPKASGQGSWCGFCC